MKVQQAELLINIDSRRSQEALPIIVEACRKEKIELTKITKIGKGTSLSKVIADTKRRAPKLLIVGGGDGTISDAIDELVGSDITLGLIALGTTNNFARSLGLPLEPHLAVAAIANRKATAVDLGKVRHDYFANVTGIGLSALVANNVSNRTKKIFGRAAYAITGIRELLRHEPFTVTVEDKDRELAVRFETHQVIVANGRYHAGKEIAKEAKLNNRELVIFRLGGRSKLSFLWHTMDFYIGKRKSISHTSYVIGRNIVLHTSTPQMVELDGEVKFTTPIPVSVEADAIRVRH